MNFLSRPFLCWMLFATIADEITYSHMGFRGIAVMSALWRILYVIFRGSLND